ncbi:CLUMA_CG016330, isoform A, partial [Clunio marinus]
LIEVFSDNRVKDLFLVQSPFPVIGILATYLYFVNGRGQKWMKNRKAFELNSIINLYNASQVVINLYIGLRALYTITQIEGFNVLCIPPPFNDYTEHQLILLKLSHLYYLLKVLDLLDTVSLTPSCTL